MRTYVISCVDDPIYERHLPHDRTPNPMFIYRSERSVEKDKPLLENYCGMNSDEDSVLEYRECDDEEYLSCRILTLKKLEDALQDFLYT